MPLLPNGQVSQAVTPHTPHSALANQTAYFLIRLAGLTSHGKNSHFCSTYECYKVYIVSTVLSTIRMEAVSQLSIESHDIIKMCTDFPEFPEFFDSS